MLHQPFLSSPVFLPPASRSGPVRHHQSRANPSPSPLQTFTQQESNQVRSVLFNTSHLSDQSTNPQALPHNRLSCPMDDDHFGHPQVNSPSCPPTIPKNNPLGTALPRPRSPGTQRDHHLPGPNHKGLSRIEERILEPQAPRSTERLNLGRPFQYHIRVSRSTERLQLR